MAFLGGTGKFKILNLNQMEAIRSETVASCELGSGSVNSILLVQSDQSEIQLALGTSSSNDIWLVSVVRVLEKAEINTYHLLKSTRAGLTRRIQTA